MNDTPPKLDEWVEEEIDIPAIEPEVKYNRVVGLKHTTRKATQKVFYSKLGSPRRITCRNKEHDWYIPDKHSHIAHCRNCTKRRFIRAVFEMVREGKILDRDTKIQID